MSGLRDILAIPFGWALNLLYQINIPYLASLVIITVVVRLALLPTSIKQQKNSAKQMRLQAKVNKIKAKYAGNNSRENQAKIQEETQELYKREGFNPANQGCLPMIITLVVMMGLYGAIYTPITRVMNINTDQYNEIKACYEEINDLETEDSSSKKASNYRIELDILGDFEDVAKELRSNSKYSVVTEESIARVEEFIKDFQIFGIDLTDTPKDEWTANGKITAITFIPVFAGLSSLLTSLYTYLKQRKTNPETAKNPAMGCMTFMSPAISIWFAWALPAGIGFYWIISGLFSFIQTVVLGAVLKPAVVIAGQMIDETVVRRSREKSVKERNAILARHRANGEE